MDDIYLHKVFSKNLTRLLGDKPQADVAKAIKVSPQTFNTWCQGKAIPRAGKLQALADYFGVNKSELLEVRTEKQMNDIQAQRLLEEHIKNYSQLQPEFRSLIDDLIKAAQEEPRNEKKILELTIEIATILRS